MAELAATESPSTQEEAFVADDWHIHLGHALGRAARWVRLSLVPGARAAFRAAHNPEVSVLLEELGELVEQHQEDGYASLKEDPQFWALVSKLHTAQQLEIEPQDAEEQIAEATVQEAPPTQAASAKKSPKPGKPEASPAETASPATTDDPPEEEPKAPE